MVNETDKTMTNKFTTKTWQFGFPQIFFQKPSSLKVSSVVSFRTWLSEIGPFVLERKNKVESILSRNLFQEQRWDENILLELSEYQISTFLNIKDISTETIFWKILSYNGYGGMWSREGCLTCPRRPPRQTDSGRSLAHPGSPPPTPCTSSLDT